MVGPATASGCLLGLVWWLAVTGCSSPQNRLSPRAWSQTAYQEQQQQQLRADPQGDRDLLAY